MSKKLSKVSKMICLDCNKILTNYRAKRCRSCANRGINNPRYKHGKNVNYKVCQMCGQKISSASAKFCIKCSSSLNKHKFKSGKLHKNYKHGLSKTKEYRRNCQLLRNYNITLREYRELLKQQNNVCKICNKTNTKKFKNKITPLVVDHDHRTGKVRGLLCNKCNSALGYFKENLINLEKAIMYLKDIKEN